MRADEGTATVEAAIALTSVVAVVVTCVGAILAVSMHVRYVDAAREAARLAARGDEVSELLIPGGASVSISEAEGFVTARVEAGTALPGLRVSGQAVAALEPGVEQ